MEIKGAAAAEIRKQLSTTTILFSSGGGEVKIDNNIKKDEINGINNTPTVEKKFKKKSIKQSIVQSMISTDDGTLSKINQYDIESFLGAGSFGNVFKVKDTSVEGNIYYAMKMLDKKRLKKKRIGVGKTALMLVKSEIAVWKRLHHPNCLCLFEVIEDDNYFFMISECIDGGAVMGDELEGEPKPIHVAKNIFSQLMEGIEYLHFNNITHRDIKPGNILLTNEGVVKIADYGVASILEEGSTTTATAGTIAFMPPEMTDGRDFDPKHHDLWSCGITLYMLIYGKTPFRANNMIDLYVQIQTQPLLFPEGDTNIELQDLLNKMLEKDIKCRLFDIEKIQTHSWLKEKIEEVKILKDIRRKAIFLSGPIVLTEKEIEESFTPYTSPDVASLITTKGIGKVMKKKTIQKMEKKRAASLMKPVIGGLEGGIKETEESGEEEEGEEDFREEEEDKDELERAAVKIQAIQRGRKIRKDKNKKKIGKGIFI